MTRALGIRRLVNEVATPPDEDLLGVALFFAPEVVVGSVASEAGLAKRAERAIAEAYVASGRNGLPPVVALAVTTGGVHVYPARFNGEVAGAEIAFWPNRTFTATSLSGWPMLRLRLGLPGLHQMVVECKTFPLGPNRHNRRVARLVQEAAGIPSTHRR